MFVSIHIPKTAGTTVGYILDYGFRRRIFYDYPELGKRDKKGYLQDEIDLISRHVEFVRAKFEVIHGHFHYKKYKDIFPDEKFIVCLRDPLKRTISQYLHILEAGSSVNRFYDDISSGRMDIVDFASIAKIKRAQSLFIEGRDIMDFDHVFLTEKLAETIYQFQINFDFSRSDPYMNKKGEESLPNTNPRSARKTKSIEFTDSQMDSVRVLLEEDYELYRRAQEKVKLQGKPGSLTNKIKSYIAGK